MISINHIKKAVLLAVIAGTAAVSFGASPVDMTIDENLACPAVSGKASSPIIRHMEKLGAVLTRHSFKVTPMRRGEVLRVSVPCSYLFDPNSEELRTGAARYLQAFRDVARLPGQYKILVVVHTDDSGSDTYLEELSSARANAIDEYYAETLGNSGLNIIPYGVGNDEPLQPNTSIGNRAANRRVDFYLVPEQGLIDQARSGKL